MVKLSPACLALIALPSVADTLPPLACEGDTPDWTMMLAGDAAQFSLSEAKEFTIPQRSVAKDRDWPKALTLIAERETAIVILNETQCSSDYITNFPIEAFVLTQQAETPVILRGCCTIVE